MSDSNLHSLICEIAKQDYNCKKIRVFIIKQKGTMISNIKRVLVMANILIISQASSQEYIDMLKSSFDICDSIDIISGSDLEGDYIRAPKHDSSSLKNRLICWIKYWLFIKKWAANNKNRHYDLIFCTSNPPINAALGIKLKKIFNSKFIYMYWDLYPQVIEALIESKLSGFVSFFWNKWNEKYFREIDQIITIGDVVKESIQKRIPYDLSIRVVPIHVDTEFIKPIDQFSNRFLKENNLEGKFIVLYSGKMGRGHDIESIVDASRILKDIEDIKFVFIGDGEKRKIVEDYINKNAAKNIILLPLQPNNIFPFSIASGDIGIVSQEQKSAAFFMPSKTYSLMAAGTAIVGICSEHDDLNDLINRYELGMTVPSGNSDKLASTIEFLYNNPKVLESYKLSARETAVNHYSKNQIGEKYKKIFDEVLQRE